MQQGQTEEEELASQEKASVCAAILGDVDNPAAGGKARNEAALGGSGGGKRPRGLACRSSVRVWEIWTRKDRVTRAEEGDGGGGGEGAGPGEG